MVVLNIKYTGQKNCELVHQPSGALLLTDAPKDNQGKGESFSPTDLLAASLISCMITTMAIKAEPQGFNLKGCFGKVIKEMSSDPRKVRQLTTEIHLPKNLTAEQKTFLENIAHGCPVKLSLHPEVITSTTFIYDL